MGGDVGPGCGGGADEFWERLVDPEARPTNTVIEDFDARRSMISKQARRSNVFAQLAVAAACLAVEDADEPTLDPDRTGVIIGSGNGGTGVSLASTRCSRPRAPKPCRPSWGPSP